MLKRAAGFRDLPCVIGRNSVENPYYLGMGTRIVGTIEEARVMTVTRAILDVKDRIHALGVSTASVMILDPEILSKEPPTRITILEEAVPPTLIALMKSAPQNPTLHGHLMVMFGKLPPPGLETFNQLKDWVEFNCERIVLTGNLARAYIVPKNVLANYERPSGYQILDVEAIRTHAPILQVNLNCGETEYGSASYTVDRRWNFTSTFSELELDRIIRAAATNHGRMSDVINDIVDQAREDAQDNDPGDGYGDYAYEPREANDTEDSYANPRDLGQLKNTLIEYISTHYGTEEEIQALLRE